MVIQFRKFIARFKKPVKGIEYKFDAKKAQEREREEEAPVPVAVPVSAVVPRRESVDVDVDSVADAWHHPDVLDVLRDAKRLVIPGPGKSVSMSMSTGVPDVRSVELSIEYMDTVDASTLNKFLDLFPAPPAFVPTAPAPAPVPKYQQLALSPIKAVSPVKAITARPVKSTAFIKPAPVIALPTCTLAAYAVLRTLNASAVCSVFLVACADITRQSKDNIRRALKVVPKADLDEIRLCGVLREQEVLRRVRARRCAGRGLLGLEASWHDESNFYLVTAYMEGGALSSVMERGILKLACVRTYAAELLNAIENLHNQNMTHRNIKPANILIGADGHLVLTGFASVDIPGFTGVCGGGEEGEDAVVMTPWYASPELLMGWENGPEVDLWALGVTVYEMLCGTVPFESDVPLERQGAHMTDLKTRIVNDPVEFDEADGVPEDARDFLERVLAKDPADRPTIEEMKSHPFFATIDWAAIAKGTNPVPFVPSDKKAARSIYKPIEREVQIGQRRVIIIERDDSESEFGMDEDEDDEDDERDLSIVAGEPYSPAEDPYPSFTFDPTLELKLERPAPMLGLKPITTHLNVSAPSVVSSSTTCVGSGGIVTAETSTISFDSLSQHIGMYVEDRGGVVGRGEKKGEQTTMLGMILAGKGELRRQETVGAGADEPVGTTTTMTMTATTTTTTTTSKGAFARWIKKVLSL